MSALIAALRRKLKAAKEKNSQLIVDHILSEGEWLRWTKDLKKERDDLKLEVEILRTPCMSLCAPCKARQRRLSP